MRAMPSPTWRTVPTSERSVSTSYCSILDLRIDVISSGRSFKASPSLARRRQVSAESFEAAADARVEAQRSCLQDDAADQVRVDRARGVDGTAGRALDLPDDLPRLVIGQLEGRRQLDGEAAFLRGHQALELAVDLAQLPGAVLLDGQQEEVAHELIGAAEDVVERLRLRPRIELRVAQHRVELRHLVDRSDEVAELLAHLGQAPMVLRGLEESARVRAVRYRHLVLRALQLREVQRRDRLVDQPALVGGVEHLAGDLRRGEQRQLGDLLPDLRE